MWLRRSADGGTMRGNLVPFERKRPRRLIELPRRGRAPWSYHFPSKLAGYMGGDSTANSAGLAYASHTGNSVWAICLVWYLVNFTLTKAQGGPAGVLPSSSGGCHRPAPHHCGRQHPLNIRAPPNRSFHHANTRARCLAQRASLFPYLGGE